MASELRMKLDEWTGLGSPSGWRLSFKTRWLYRGEPDDRPSNDRGDMDWTRYAEVLAKLEGKSSEPRVKYRRKG